MPAQGCGSPLPGGTGAVLGRTTPTPWSCRAIVTFAVLVHISGCAAPVQLPVDDAVIEARWLVKRGANLGERAAHPTDDELDARLALARALLDEGELDAALAHLTIVQRAEPNWYSYRLLYARALYLGRGDLDGALAQLDACLSLDPRVEECWQARGDVLRDLQRPADAVDSYLRARDEGADDDALLDALARAALAAERHDVADEAASTLLDRRYDAPTLTLLARVAEARGDLDAADRLLVEALDTYDDEVRGLRVLRAFRARSGGDVDAVEAAIRDALDGRGDRRSLRPLRPSIR